MKTTFAVTALLALAGTSHGFTVYQLAIQPNATIAPSSGGFVNQASIHSPAGMVTGSYLTWKFYGSYIATSTWLGVDRYGGGGTYFGQVANATMTAFIPAPEWNNDTGNILGGPGLGAANPAPNIDGGDAGVTWGAGDLANFAAPSAVSPVNGTPIDSLMIAQFVLTDPNATLTGDDLLVTFLSGDVFVPLDGSKAAEAPVRIEYERELIADGQEALVRAFLVAVPTPGAMGLMGITGLAALRRRRR